MLHKTLLLAPRHKADPSQNDCDPSSCYSLVTLLMKNYKWLSVYSVGSNSFVHTSLHLSICRPYRHPNRTRLWYQFL